MARDLAPAEAKEVPSSGPLEIPIESILPGANVREHADPEGIKSLAESIQKHGILSPLLVTPLVDGQFWELVCGARRLEAAKLAGLTVVPVVERLVTNRDRIAIQFAENQEREDLLPMDRAKVYATLRDAGFTMEQIEAATGDTKPTIYKYLACLELPKDVQKKIGSALSIRAVQEAQRLPDAEKRDKVLRKAAKEEWSAAAVAKAVDRILKEGTGKPKADTARSVVVQVQIKLSTWPEERRAALTTLAEANGMTVQKLVDKIVTDALDRYMQQASDQPGEAL